MIVTHKGIKINYQVSGKGPALVFLHGFLENMDMWKAIIPFFSTNYTCITIDLLGHGKTNCIGYIHTMEDMAHAIKTVLNKLTLTDIALVGHSMGGYVALAYVDLFPDTVSSIALVNSTSFPDNDQRKINRDRAIHIVKKNPEAYTHMAIANLFAKENRSIYTAEINTIKKEASKTPLQGIIAALEGMKIRKDCSEVLLNFKGPKIIFAGKKDPVLSYKQNSIESKQYKTEFILFDGGHMSYIENKKEFVQELKQFFSSK